jgi:hypothetical protein
MRAAVAHLAGVAAIVACSAIASAQIGGKPVTGNPTPGLAQPDPPNPADRVTFTGCLQAVARAATPADANTPSNARFELTKVERSESKSYRLEGIDSQFSPFVGSKVEITGEIKGPATASPPTLVVEFVQRLAAKCS